MNIVGRILGGAMTPYQKRIYKDPKKAVGWAITYGQRFPEAEPYIATSPKWAYNYAKDVIKRGRWPEGEPAIAMDPMWAYKYADDILGGRFPEAEPAIAKSPWAGLYLRSFPEAKLEWVMNGLLDWLDL
jgi:hypothetical protein